MSQSQTRRLNEVLINISKQTLAGHSPLVPTCCWILLPGMPTLNSSPGTVLGLLFCQLLCSVYNPVILFMWSFWSLGCHSWLSAPPSFLSSQSPAQLAGYVYSELSHVSVSVCLHLLPYIYNKTQTLRSSHVLFFSFKGHSILHITQFLYCEIGIKYDVIINYSNIQRLSRCSLTAIYVF